MIKFSKLMIGLMIVVQGVNMGFVLAQDPTTARMLFHSVIFLAIVAMFINVSKR